MKKHCPLLFLSLIISFAFAGCASSAKTSTPEIAAPIPSEPQPTPDDLPIHQDSAMIPLIFSHGGAPCDIGALVYFSMHPDVDLIGMVISRGEIHPEIGLNKWATFLFDVLEYKHIPIGLGSDERMDPDSHDFPESWRAGGDNFWGWPLPQPYTEYEPLIGHEMIVEQVNASPNKVTIIAMASMIDLALALQQDPGIIDNIEHIIIMGGAFTVPGNLDDAPYEIDNEVAEWNMWIDAQAAKYVINSGARITMVALDAIQYLVQPGDVNTINSIDNDRVRYVANDWNKQIGVNPGGFLIWDTITAVAVTNPEHFFWTVDGIDVVAESGKFQGQTIALNNGAAHTRYATGADYQAIMEILFEVFGETASSTPHETPIPAESDAVVTGLGGVWEGFTGEFHITFTLGDECRLHEVCGTFEIPEFGMTGDVSFVAVEGSRYVFRASNISTGIQGNEYEYLELLPDGTLLYHTEDGGVISEAILYRQ